LNRFFPKTCCGGAMKKIYTVMMNEQSGRPVLGFFLQLIAMIYGAAVRIRSFLFDRGIIRSRRLPCRVVSVGNITAGGTGKTPMTIRIVELARQLGLRPVILSRGYKGGAEKSGGIVSDGINMLMSPAMAGDEPFMMARRLPGVPVLVGADRRRMGHMAMAAFSPDLIVLDDGFQHRYLRRDLDLVLVDDRTFLGNGRLLPRGLLREPASALHRADAVILTRCNLPRSMSFRRLATFAPGKPLFISRHAPYVDGIYQNGDSVSLRQEDPARQDFSLLNHAGVMLFSGIARNAEFSRMIVEAGASVLEAMEFPDHHPYTDRDCKAIIRRAKELSPDYLVTTEKDFIRIMDRLHTPVPLVVVGVRIDFGPDTERFAGFLRERLKQFRPPGPDP
jgi:tetraacyldisaccharide 4'-kinase